MRIELTFYFDRCFGKKFPSILEQAKPPFKIQSHYICKFPDDMKDDDWLSYVGQKGWIVFSLDHKFHKNKTEAAAIKQHNIGCFYLDGASSGTWERLISFARGYSKVEDVIRAEKKPFLFHVGRSGHIKKNIKN